MENILVTIITSAVTLIGTITTIIITHSKNTADIQEMKMDIKEKIEAIIEEIKKKQNPGKIYIEAQCYATGFYEKEGFRICSGEFLEDGIPHVQMELILPMQPKAI